MRSAATIELDVNGRLNSRLIVSEPTTRLYRTVNPSRAGLPPTNYFRFNFTAATVSTSFE